MDRDIGPEFTEIVHEVEGEAVVIVDEHDHRAVPAGGLRRRHGMRSRNRIGSNLFAERGSGTDALGELRKDSPSRLTIIGSTLVIWCAERLFGFWSKIGVNPTIRLTRVCRGWHPNVQKSWGWNQ